MYSGTTTQLSGFCDLISELNLSQLVLSTTHKAGNILDLVLINNDEIIHDVTIHIGLPNGLSSDHFLIKFRILIAMDHHVPTPVSPYLTILKQIEMK